MIKTVSFNDVYVFCGESPQIEHVEIVTNYGLANIYQSNFRNHMGRIVRFL